MAEVRLQGHDFKVLFRRLIVPGELGRNLDLIQSPSQFAGLFDLGQDPTARNDVQSDLDAANGAKSSKAFASYADKVFSDHQPAAFKPLVVAKAIQVADEYINDLAAKNKRKEDIKKQIAQETEQVLSIVSGTASGKLMDKTQSKILSDAHAYHSQHIEDPVKFEAGQHQPGDQTPRTRDRDGEKENPGFIIIQDVAHGLFALGLSGTEKNIVDDILAVTNLLITGSPSATVERDARARLVEDLKSILDRRSLPRTVSQRVNATNETIGLLRQKLASVERDIKLLEASGKMRPFYEPILLDCLIGPQAIQASTNRQGQPGTASVSFHLPLDSQGAVPALFMGLRVDDIFNLSMLESQPSARSSSLRSTSIPSQVLSILKPNLRETTILPFDMIQIWGRKKLSTGAQFPGDYAPIFTGFVTKTTVGYVGSTVSVQVSAEDVGKILRLARVNVDPNFDPRFNAPGVRPVATNNVLSSTQFKTGADIIEGLIVGKSGTFLGISQVDVVQKVQVTPKGGQTIPEFQIGTKVISLAADFQNLKLNLFTDLLNRWKPYAVQFRNAFRLWETDARTKWDICQEVADITEYEFYVDSMGVINYHPPLYFLNPFAPQYYIENVDIDSESHVVDESEVLTVVEVHSQAGYNLSGGAFDAGRRNDSLISAPDRIIQRFGQRWQKKEVPIFSGTDEAVSKVDPGIRSEHRDTGRDGYARAWINRRNARLRSATVTINGTPEIRVCNTVAFVGDLKAILRSVSTNQMAAAASGILTSSSLPVTSLGSLPVGSVAALRDVMVYYVTAIGHNYVQGGKYQTTLTLTHGRHWTDPLPQGSVGYALDGKHTDDVVKDMRAYFGQDGTDPDAFARTVNNKIQFIATGDTTFLDPVDDSQFGLTARLPKLSKLAQARAKLSSEIRGAIDRQRTNICKKLSRENDPNQIEKKVKDVSESKKKGLRTLYDNLKKQAAGVLTSIDDFIDSIHDAVSAGFTGKLSALAARVASEAEDALGSVTSLSNAQAAAFNAILGNGRSFRNLSETVADAGIGLPSQITSSLSNLGLNISDITNFEFGIAIFMYMAKSEVGESDAVDLAEKELLKRASELLRPLNDKNLVVVLSSIVESVTLSNTTLTLTPGEPLTIPTPPQNLPGLSTPDPVALAKFLRDSKGSTGIDQNLPSIEASTKNTVHILGMMAIGNKPSC